MLTEHQRRFLLKVAASSIRYGLSQEKPLDPDRQDAEPVLLEHRASFVSLHQGEKLRGCVGTLVADTSLIQSVSYYAYSAAFRDLRFSPLTGMELADLNIHISVLTDPAPIPCQSESELVSQLRRDIDGLILREGDTFATFLPSVWEQIRSPADFIRHLKKKAGLPELEWRDTIRAERYQTESFGGSYIEITGSGDWRMDGSGH